MIERALLAVEFGFSVQEIIWIEEDDQFSVLDTLDFDPINVKLNIDDFGNVYSYTIPSGISVPEDKAFIFTYRKEFGNPYGSSRLLPVYDVWRTKELIWLFTNRYFERKGNPPTIVKYPASPNKKEMDNNADEALEMGKALLENAVVALPSTRDETGKEIWNVGYLTDDARAGMFLSYLEYLDRMILRAMFIPDRVMTQEGSSGSYALARAHLDLFLISEDGLIADLEEEINRQLVSKIIEYNFGIKFSNVQLRISRLSRTDRELLGSVFIEMVKNGDAKLPADTLAKELGFPTF
ncbi:MAG: phage portal protein family protein [bacterium]